MPRRVTEYDRMYSRKTRVLRVKEETYERLFDDAEYGDTADTLVRRLLNFRDEVKEDRGH